MFSYPRRKEILIIGSLIASFTYIYSDADLFNWTQSLSTSLGSVQPLYNYFRN